MIKITKVSKEDNILKWSTTEWHKADKVHYGRRVEWKEKKFRFIAKEDDKVVGFIYGKHESGVVYIGGLITAEEVRGKGIGTKLVQKAEKWGKKLGAHRLWLITGRNWAENAFYRKLGFKLIANLPDFHFHKDFVVYTRPIK
jgi:GNAT superfamily N-acetyltransferase